MFVNIECVLCCDRYISRSIVCYFLKKKKKKKNYSIKKYIDLGGTVMLLVIFQNKNSVYICNFC